LSFALFFFCPINGAKHKPQKPLPLTPPQQLVETVKNIFTQQRDIDLNAIDQQITLAKKSGLLRNLTANKLAEQVYDFIYNQSSF